MEDVAFWFLQNVFSPLILPLFIVAMLFHISGANPMPVLTLLLGFIEAIFWLSLKGLQVTYNIVLVLMGKVREKSRTIPRRRAMRVQRKTIIWVEDPHAK